MACRNTSCWASSCAHQEWGYGRESQLARDLPAPATPAAGLRPEWGIVGTHPLSKSPTTPTQAGSGTGSVDAAAPVCVRWCFLRCPICEKSFPQSAQRYGRSPVCVRWCILRYAICAKSLPHSAQWCGSSPVCVRWCLLRCAICAKLLSQSRGRSPVCVRWCILRYAICAKPLSQSEQRYGRSPVCVRWCILSFELSSMQCWGHWPMGSLCCVARSGLWLSLPRGWIASCAWIPLWAVGSCIPAALSPHSACALFPPEISCPAGESRGNPGVSSWLNYTFNKDGKMSRMERFPHFFVIVFWMGASPCNGSSCPTGLDPTPCSGH
uniref:Uncharacterized protein n=1 Tax=Chrysemys picta bellii TaxID=8478 RepID=A0A8C3HNP4_CHRPI